MSDEDNTSESGSEVSAVEDRFSNGEKSEEEADTLLNKWKGKRGSKRKRRGRRSSWSIDIINDLVDIIVSSEV